MLLTSGPGERISSPSYNSNINTPGSDTTLISIKVYAFPDREYNVVYILIHVTDI